MGRERTSSMNYKFLDYIDEWETFCNIDWGKFNFDMTMKRLKKGLQDKVDKWKESTDKKQQTYSLYIPFTLSRYGNMRLFRP